MSEKDELLQSLDELAAEGDEIDFDAAAETFDEIEALRAERDDYARQIHAGAGRYGKHPQTRRA